MRRTGLFLLSTLACATIAQAQTSSTTGAVRGVISVKGGSRLAGALVSVKALETGITRTATTNADGEYAIGLLLVGRYEATVTAPGMRTIKNDQILVTLGTATTINIRMDKAEAAATVEVVAADAALDRTNVSNSVTIDEALVTSIPLNGRNFTDLVKLTPGAVNDSSTNGGHEFIGGARDIYNNLTIDGASYNSSFYGGVRGSTTTPFAFGLDTIKELQVITDPYDPMYGNVAGGVINAVSKTGSNDLEGSALLQLRPSSLVAMRRPVPFDLTGGNTNSVAARTRDFSQQQYNVNVGGPIIKDKLFYFVGVEAFHYSQSSTQAMGFGNAGTQAQMNTFLGDLGNLIVGNGGQTLSQQNGMGMTLDRKNSAVLARVDWNINENHRFDLRLNTQQFTNKNGSINGATSPTTLPSDDGTDYYNDISWVAELNSSLGANMTNEARLQISTERRPRTPNSTASPEFVVSGGFSAGMIWYEPSNLNEFTKQFIDTFTFLQGEWAYKAGVDLQWFNYQNQFPQYAGGYYSFSNYQTAIDWATGTPLATLQGAGTATFKGSLSPTNGWIDYSSSLLTGFVSVTNSGLMNHRLNVVLGARITRENAADNPRPLAQLAGTDSPDSCTSVDPRFAFTYDLKGDGRTLIKGGYGWFTSPDPSLTVSNTMTSNGRTISVYTITSKATDVNSGYWAPTGALGAAQVLNNNTLSTLSPAQLGGLTTAAITGQLWDPTNKMPLAKRASLGIEQKLPDGIIVGGRLEYAQFYNEQYFENANLTQQEGGGVTGSYNDGYPTLLNAFSNARPGSAVVGGRFVNLAGFSDVYVSENKGIGRYKALILTAARHSDNGFGFQSSLTFANTLDMNSNERITNGGISVSNNPANPRANFGPSDDDVRFRAVFAGYFPIYWGIKGVANFTYQSGLPYSAMAGYDVNGDGNGGNDYAPGYGGRNAYRQPGAKTFDFRLVRAFNPAPKVVLEASIDIYNFFNWANWTTSQTTALKTATTVNPNFGLLDQADSNSREVQFGFRLRF